MSFPSHYICPQRLKQTTMRKVFLIFAAFAALFISCEKNDTNSLDGRWDGVMDESEVGKGMQRLTFIFNGNNVDVYIVAWGDHIKGTYTYENNILNVNVTEAWDALIKTESYSGWNMADGALDPETFELKYTDELPYRWYAMEEDEKKKDIEFLSNIDFTITGNGKATSNNPMPLTYIKR